MALVQILLRRDTTTNWTDVNPVLGKGEPGWDLTAKILKIGDGTTAWNSLEQYGSDLPTGVVSGSSQISFTGITDKPTLVSGSSQLTSSYDTRYVNESGDTMSGTLNVPNMSTDYITFDTTPETTSTNQGTFIWNTDEVTMDLIQNGTTLQLGQESQYNVRNNSGQLIPNGTPVMASGTLGTSGRITIAPMNGSSPVYAKYFLGLTTEDIANDADGKVTHFGKVREIDTTMWNEGDILYVSSSANGELTNVHPTAPDMIMPVAFVINSHNNGTLFVRVNNLNESQFVHTFGDNTISGTLNVSGSLVLNTPLPPTSISGSGTKGEIRTDENYMYVCTATNTWKRTTLNTW